MLSVQEEETVEFNDGKNEVTLTNHGDRISVFVANHQWMEAMAVRLSMSDAAKMASVLARWTASDQAPEP